MDRIVFKVILLVIILGAIGYLSISAETYSCNKCSITFLNPKAMGIENIDNTFNITLIKLYKASNQNDCPVYWDRVRGYVRQ